MASSRALLVLLACASALAACVPRHREPVAGAKLLVAAESFADDGPFRVVFAGPKGEASTAQLPREITLSFSRAVRALTVQDEAPARPPATVTRAPDGAAVEGSWRYFGERTAVFWPSSGFAPATEYRVTVDAALHAFDGATLGDPPSFSFVTPRPSLTAVAYEYDTRFERHLLDLDFNQSIAPARVARSIRVEGRSAKGVEVVPFRVLAGAPDSHVQLHVERKISALEGVTVIAATALVGEDGPLASDHESRLPVPDLGPFRAELLCHTSSGDERVSVTGKPLRCSLQNGEVDLRLTRSVPTTELWRHLVLSTGRLPKPPKDEETSQWLPLSSLMTLAAGRKFRVTVKAGLHSDDKDVLAADQVLDLEIEDEPAAVRFRDLGHEREAVVESARSAVSLELSTMNVAAVDAVRAPLDEAHLFDLLLGKAPDAALVRALPGSVSSRHSVKAAKNEYGATRFDIPLAMRPRGAPGAFAVATQSPGLPDDVRVLSFTDLGVTSKWSPHGGLFWITRLSTGRPVAGASVSLRRATRGGAGITSSEVFSATTNAAGVASIPAQATATFLDVDAGDERASAILVVKDGADYTYSVLPPLDPSLARGMGYLFTDRRLYRPGETAFVKGVFRSPTARGLVSLPGRTVTVESTDDDARVLFATTAVLDAFGAFSVELPIPRTAHLGGARVRARVGTQPPARGGIASPHARHSSAGEWPAVAYFVIDEYRTVEFKVEMEHDHPDYQRGDVALVTTRGKYLMGASMHDVPVEISARRTTASFRPPGLESFMTDTYGLSRRVVNDTVVSLQPKLGADGSITVPVPLALPEQEGPETVMVDASVADVSRAFAAGADTSFLVHPGELYLGVRPDRTRIVYPNQKVRVELAAAGIDGARRARVHARVELLEARDDPEPPASTGRGCDLETALEVVTCELAVGKPGTYWLRAFALDARGRSVAAAASFMVPAASPPPPPPRPRAPEPPAPPEPPPPPMLSFDDACRAPPRKDEFYSLLVEGDSWARRLPVGGVARTCLRGPGDALLTVEREGVLTHDVRRLGVLGTRFDLPIAPEYHPDVRLALFSVSGRSAPFPALTGPARGDFGHPTSSSADTELRITAPDRKLTVAIEVPPEVRPGTELTARLRVVDGAGKPTPAQVTLWAVDEGAFLLHPFQVPSLAEVFAEERGTDVLTSDTRSILFWEKVGTHVVKSPSLRQGATQSGGRDYIGRSVFRPTAWFLPSVVTDASGVAVVKARLPDNLTTWKVFAVAVGASDGFGNGEATFRTNKLLMARPALPRFLRVGDRIDAAVVVDSLAKEPLAVNVSMRAFGPLAARGPATTRIVVPPEGHVPVHFTLEALAASRGSVSFRAEAPREKLTDEVTIDEMVSVPTTFETVVLEGETNARKDEPLGDLSRARADVGGLDYRLSATPLVGLAESLEALVEYPYGCTEQLTSRLVPLVRLRALARELAVALPADVDGAVRTSLASLLTHQRADGGFGFWQQSAKSEPWLTVAALNALYAARTAGYVVPPEPMDRAALWLDKAESLDDASRAMLEDMFATNGLPREKELRALAGAAGRDAADHHLPAFARALLAHALAKVDRALAIRMLDGLTAQTRITGATAIVADEPGYSWRTHLSSDARTTAMALRAYVALDPKNALVTKLVRGLLGLRHEGRWTTTQSSAWALLALDEARALYATGGGPNTAHISLDGKEIERVVFGSSGGAREGRSGASGTIAMGRLAAAPGAVVSFTTEGGPLFYESALRYARRDPPKTPLEHGLYVTKTMRVMRRDAEPVPATELRTGDYVEVDVLLSTPVARELVVLDDPLPSGFEAVNQSFANADRQAMRMDKTHLVTHRELRDDRVVSFFDELPAGQHHTSYVLRVMSSGHFVVPATKASCMYAPDVYGRTAAAEVDARP